jgi:hypothetical protein
MVTKRPAVALMYLALACIHEVDRKLPVSSITVEKIDFSPWSFAGFKAKRLTVAFAGIHMTGLVPLTVTFVAVNGRVDLEDLERMFHKVRKFEAKIDRMELV